MCTLERQGARGEKTDGSSKLCKFPDYIFEADISIVDGDVTWLLFAADKALLDSSLHWFLSDCSQTGGPIPLPSSHGPIQPQVCISPPT